MDFTTGIYISCNRDGFTYSSIPVRLALTKIFKKLKKIIFYLNKQ
jgi:hypothetical protein